VVAQAIQDLLRVSSLRSSRAAGKGSAEGDILWSPLGSSPCEVYPREEGLQVACLAGSTAEGRIYLFGVREIIYCGRDGRRSFFKTEQGEFFSAFTLEKLAARLKPFGFFRSHRCYLVNLDWVEGIVKISRGTYDLLLRDREKNRIPLSREHARELRQMLLRDRFKF